MQILRQIMNEFIVPALDGKTRAADQVTADALAKELAMSEQSRPAPGAASDPYETDTPRK